MRKIWLSLMASTILLAPCQAMAQRVPSPAAAVQSDSKRTYTPADFSRYSPKTAYDMLVQVPGFTIRSADDERGLGQASENVLINGQRIANKSGGAIDELRKTSAANVARIEIVSAASLGIAGLSGQVANIVLTQSQAASGQFEWSPTLRAHYAKSEWLGGSASYSSKLGPLDYTLSVKNDGGQGGFGGPVRIYDASGALIETRQEVFKSGYDFPNMQAKFGLKGPGSSIANLTLAYTPYWNPAERDDERLRANGERRSRINTMHLNGYYADINGDFEFALGHGRMKLIGVRHWDHAPLVDTQILTFDTSRADPIGVRFGRDTHTGETIGRGEYRWKTGRNDWQISFERAFNSLDQKGSLEQLEHDGTFVPIPFPNGSGKVVETRYESIATLSRPLSSKVDLQVTAGAELSHLTRVDDTKPPRKFVRPKGSISVSWRPAKSWDLSLKLRRRVGQISFYDFLAQPKLSDDRQNAGNPDLVPPQSWEVETEFSYDLGKWGKTRLNLHYYRVADIIDVIPIGDGGEGIGNLPRASRLGFESVSTLQFAPLGWNGAKLDLTVGAEQTRVRDPLLQNFRPISGVQDRWATAQLRDDLPHSKIALGAYVAYQHYAKHYYLTEVYSALDLPWIAGGYIEHKDLRGLTVRFTVDNVFNGRHFLNRTVYSGYRDRTPVSFIENHDQLVGPIFSLSVKGSF